MPVLDATERIAPKSALRHRPIDSSPATSSPLVPRASRTRSTDADEQVVEWHRPADETKKLRDMRGKTVQEHAPFLKALSAKALNRHQTWRHMHPLVYLGVGMLAALCL